MKRTIKMKIKVFKPGLFIAIILALSTTMPSCGNRSEGYSANVTQENNHWIYTISYGDKIVIKQETMPGLNRIAYFPDRETAMKTALLVRHRLNRGINPAISAPEMDSILRIGHHK